MIDAERAINDLQLRCHNLEKNLFRIEAKIDSLCKAALHQETISQRIDRVAESFDQDLDAQKKSTQEFKTDVSNSFDKVKENINFLLIALKQISENIRAHTNELNLCKEKHETFFSTATANLSSVRDELRREFLTKLQSLPKPIIPTDQDIIKIIESKNEPVALDAKNGVLRSQHCDMKIQIMEKKIDQLFLILQKNSLTP